MSTRQQNYSLKMCVVSALPCRAGDASKYVQKYLKFDATFYQKPLQLPENWCDAVTAWCEGDYPGSDVLYSLELSQVFEWKSS